MKRLAAIVVIASVALSGVTVASYGLEKSEFVGKCLMNGRDYKPCACTYNALPDLPDAYADLAVSWAHDEKSDYQMTYLKTVVRDLIPMGGGRKTSYGRPVQEGEQSYFGKLLKSVGTSAAMKWVVGLIPGVDGGTSLVVTSATRATGKFGYARYVFDRHCDRRLETVSNELSRMTSAAGDATRRSYDAVASGISDAAGSAADATVKATRTTLDVIGRSIGLEPKETDER